MKNFFVVSGDERFCPPCKKKYIYTQSEFLNFSEKYQIAQAKDAYTKKELIEIQKIISEKYCHSVEALGLELNSLFNEQFPPKFWKKSLSLGYKRYLSILHMAFTEFSSIDYNQYKIYAVLDENSYLIPDDFEEQREFIQNTDLGREQLFSIYIRKFHPHIYEKALKIKIDHKKKKSQSTLSKLKFNFLRIKSSLLNKNTPVILGILDSFFLKEDYVKLSRNNKIKTLLFKNNKTHKHRLHPERGSLGFSLCKNDDFDVYFIESLKSLFPTFFIEQFLSNKNFYIKQLNMYPNLKYIICEAWISSTKDSFVLALAKEYKSIIHIYNEHNSLSHPFLGNNSELTASLVDIYYTLGWDLNSTKLNTKIPNIKSGASLFFDNHTGPRIFKKGQLLFLDVATFGYLEEYNTYYSESDVYAKYYFQFLKDFFDEINGNLKLNIIYRGYPVGGRNWMTFDNKSILEKHFPPNIIIDDMSLSGSEMMKRSELNIIPYTNTAYLQSLILDVPTIFFWNKDIAHLDSNFIDFFNVLIDVGICHTSPKNAAIFLSSIENDIQGWWLNKDTMLARKIFLDKNIGNSKKAHDYYTSLVNF